MIKNPVLSPRLNSACSEQTSQGKKQEQLRQVSTLGRSSTREFPVVTSLSLEWHRERHTSRNQQLIIVDWKARGPLNKPHTSKLYSCRSLSKQQRSLTSHTRTHAPVQEVFSNDVTHQEAIQEFRLTAVLPPLRPPPHKKRRGSRFVACRDVMQCPAAAGK